jgi:putative transposase
VQHESPRQLLRQCRHGSFFSTVKNEVGERYESHGEAKGQLFDYIEVFYNQRRRHSSAGRMSPAAFERKMTQAA